MKHLLVVVAAGTLLLGCGRPNNNQAPGAPSSSKEGQIIIKGSDTMLHLVADWAEAYMGQNPQVGISVTGGGSGTGIAALLNGTTDICAASREISPDEKVQAQQRNLHPQEIPVARDGIAIVVNPANPVGELTIEQVGKIYSGAYTDWKEVGGSEGAITVLSRESSSGTYAFFQEHVLNKRDYTPRARLMPATSAIVQAVGDDVHAIGYVGLGYVSEAGQSVKELPIKADANAPAVAASEETVKNGTYSISRALYFYTSEPPVGHVAAFITFCRSEAGRVIVRATGYVPEG